MFIALDAVDALADDAACADEVAGAALLELLELLHAASPRAAAATAATAALRPRDRVAGKEGTAKLLCARSLGGGLAVRPVGRVPARLTGFLMGSARCDHPRLAGLSGSYRHKTSTPRRGRIPAKGYCVTD